MINSQAYAHASFWTPYVTLDKKDTFFYRDLQDFTRVCEIVWVNRRTFRDFARHFIKEQTAGVHVRWKRKPLPDFFARLRRTFSISSRWTFCRVRVYPFAGHLKILQAKVKNLSNGFNDQTRFSMMPQVSFQSSKMFTLPFSMMGQGEEVGVIPRFCEELFGRVDDSHQKDKVGCLYYRVPTIRENQGKSGRILFFWKVREFNLFFF